MIIHDARIKWSKEWLSRNPPPRNGLMRFAWWRRLRRRFRPDPPVLDALIMAKSPSVRAGLFLWLLNVDDSDRDVRDYSRALRRGHVNDLHDFIQAEESDLKAQRLAMGIEPIKSHRLN